MPISPEIIRETKDLLALLREGMISDEQSARLVELLRGEEELRRLYVQYVAMEEHLRENLSDYTFVRDPNQSESAAMLMDALENRQASVEEEKDAETPDEVVFGQVVEDTGEDYEEMRIGPLTPLPKAKPTPDTNKRPNHWLAGGVAAAVALIVTTSVLMSPKTWQSAPVPPPPAAPAVLARVTEENGATWESTPSPTSELAGLNSLNLLAGSAKLTFAGGAEVIVEGPARFNLDSASGLTLRSGKLTATAHGGGFIVRTPTAVVTDLGTEFGVAAKDSGAVVCVFKGSVAVAPKAGDRELPATLVPAGTGIQEDTSGQIAQAPPSVSLSFMRNEEFQAQIGAAKGSDFDHWQAYTYKVRRDPDLVAFFDFDSTDQGTNRLTNLAATGSAYDATLESASKVTTLWSQGRVPGKGAISIQADGDAAYVNVPNAMKDLTIVAWVRLDALPKYYGGIFSSPGSESGRSYFGIKRMADLNFHGYVGGSGAIHPLDRATTLTRWTQVAAVYDSDAKAASLYARGQFLGSEKLVTTGPIVPGKVSIGCWFPRTNQAYRFTGAIDEIQLYRRALKADEIQSLYRDGRP